MGHYYPRTTLRLILYAFAVVALPLVIALGLAAVYMERLVDQSQNAVYRAVQATRDSRILTQQVMTLERRGRQYLVLRDEGLLESYNHGRIEILRSLDQLRQMPADHDLVDTFAEAEATLAIYLADADPAANETAENAADGFSELHQLAQAILADSSRQIDLEVEVMQRTGSAAQRVLIALAVTLIPLTLVSVGVFTTLISRPIRQVEHSIRTLGSGDFDRVIEVTGPRDLQLLGKRMDWLRQRLRKLEDQKTRFLQHMSHELKTPLTAIRESVGLLNERVVGPLTPQQAEISQILHSNARKLQRLIEDLLDFGTMQAHNATLNLNTFRFDQLIEEVATNHKPALLSKDIRLDCDLERTTVTADREMLATVVDNLLSNALKYSPTGGTVRAHLERVENQVVLSVSDEGPGIKGEDRERVFDAFYRVGGTGGQGIVKGTGLGLSIAREYVVAHDGTIEVADRTEPGACLRVTIPCTLGQQQPES